MSLPLAAVVHGSSAHSYERCFFTTRCNCKAVLPVTLVNVRPLRSRSRSSIILAFCKTLASKAGNPRSENVREPATALGA